MVEDISPVHRAEYIDNSRATKVIDNVGYLEHLNGAFQPSKLRIQRIMDGGRPAVEELMGQSFAGQKVDMPFANLMLNAAQKMGQKLGRYPEAVIEPPMENDSDRARNHAGIRAEICDWLDRSSKLNLRLPQAGRWVPGYGFAAFTIKESTDRSGQPFPHVQLRDPFTTYPGPWGLDQQPQQIAFKYSVPWVLAKQYYPKLDTHQNRQMLGLGDIGRGPNGAVLLDSSSTYTSQGGQDITLYEYVDKDGTYVVSLDAREIVSYTPNPIAPTTPFYVIRRFSFNKLTSAYEHAIGLMGAMARANVLMIKAMENAVGSEVNIFGDMTQQKYRQGSGQVNRFNTSARVEFPNRTMPYQIFQHREGLSQDARIMLSYPVTEDAQAPMSFITGRGVEELNASISGEVNEYLTLFRDAIEEIDFRRLKWLEKTHPENEYSINGLMKKAQYDTTFKPSVQIKGRYDTTRPYGLMASLDDTNRLIGMLHLMQNGIIDKKTVRENTDLDNILKIEGRLREENATEVVGQIMTQMALQGSMEAAEAMIETLPEGEQKKLFQRALTQAQQAPPPEQAAAPQGLPEDVNTLLARATTSGNNVLGSQSVV